MDAEIKFVESEKSSDMESNDECEDYTKNRYDDDNSSSSDEGEYGKSFNKLKNKKQRLQSSASSSNECSSQSKRPTRIPDPNTFNRNALMARENRRRKKEYVERLEKDIHNCNLENKNLRKMLKKQSKLVRKLSQEKAYFRNILANKSQILSLVKVIKTAKYNITSSEFYNDDSEGNTNTPRSSPHSVDQQNLNGTNISHDPYLTSAIFDTNKIYSTDYRLPLDSPTTNWNSIFSDHEIMTNSPAYIPDIYHDVQSNISDEHNYFTTNTPSFPDAGVCLHVSGEHVSLEFCPTCHQNARQKMLDEN